MFTSAEFPPAAASFSTIDLDPVYGGTLLPCGGACQLITSCLTNVPHFGESLRVLDLTGQYVSPEQVSQLFSETLSPRLPKLKSASFRLFIIDPTLCISTAVAPPEIEHLELHMEILAPQFIRWMIQPLMPLMKKVKHLGWYRGFVHVYDMEEILIRGRLDSLKTLETREEYLLQFGTFPSNSMPSLERLIVHNNQFSYSVDLKQIYGTIGRPFPIKQNMFNEYKQYRDVIRGTTAILHLKKNVDGIEAIHSRPETSELLLFPRENWACDLLEFEVLPLMLTLVNLDSVVVLSSEHLSCYSTLGQLSNLDELHKAFQFPSVRQLEFIGDVGDLSNDLHATFLRMFPNLDTLLNPPIRCFDESQSCNQIELACLRKLVLLHARAAWNNEIAKCLHQWPTLDAFFIRYEDDMHWPVALMDELAKHRSLRHLCIIVEARRKTCHLLTREVIEGLVDAWADRDWVSMFFIWHACFFASPATSIISAMHEDDGSIKYEEMCNISFHKIVLSFPQCYTLFWQHAVSPLFPP